MKVGITLPQFSDDVETAIAVARDAEAAELDGVFVFDHLWPIGQPEKPSMYSLALLGALAAETSRIDVGTLVARVGLLPDAVLVNALATVGRMVGARLIAGVGTGDKLSRAENEAYGVPYESAAVRLGRVARVVAMLGERGITAWVGGRSAATRELASSLGVPLNLWTPTTDELHGGDITWGGPVRPETDVAALLGELADAGVRYAVCAPVGFEWREAAGVIASSAAGVRR